MLFRSVTNLNFFMEDADHAYEVLAAAGAKTKLRLPIGAGLRALLGPDLARPEEEMRTLYFMGSRPLIGFDLEFTNRPWPDGVEQRVFYPSFTYPRPTSNHKVERLAALRVVVDDLERAVGNLTTLIHPDSRSEPYDQTSSAAEREIRVRLHDLELRYTQPLSTVSPYHSRLAVGGGIESAIFRTADPDAIVASVTDASVEQRDGGLRIGSREIVGFDIELQT